MSGIDTITKIKFLIRIISLTLSLIFFSGCYFVPQPIAYEKPVGEPVPTVFIDGNYYWILTSFEHSTEYDVEAPDDSLICGVLHYNNVDKVEDLKNEEANFSECNNQPYAFIGDDLVVHIYFEVIRNGKPKIFEKWVKMQKDEIIVN